jgi:gliding motility-associated-like protein
MNRLFIYSVISVLLSGVVRTNVHAQRNNIWYFGDSAGISFNSRSPIALTNSAMNQLEGSATMSDADGNLLFYTDGQSVWNAKHQKMPNGTGLWGDPSATQSALIIPKPGACGSYYIFTVPEVEAGGSGKSLSYFVVDMNEDGGLGDVIQNGHLHPKVTERLTCVLHSNEKDYWLIAQERGTNAILSYPVSAAGVGIPVITKFPALDRSDFPGIDTYGEMHRGYMKISGDGKKLCYTGYGYLDSLGTHSDTTVLMDFNNNTGTASNPAILTHPDRGYGVEFSPDNTKLYVSNRWYPLTIYQYDLTGGSGGTIQYPETVIGINGLAAGGALQLGPDQKIYVAQYLSTFLGAINFPNLPGPACDYTSSAISLNGKTCLLGLPNYVRTNNILPDRISLGNDTSICPGSSILVQSPAVGNYTWYKSSTDQGPFLFYSDSPAIHITDSGFYLFELADCPLYDTINISLLAKPAVDLGNDTLLCYGSGMTLQIDNNDPAIRYRWQAGQTASSIVVNAPGLYWLEVNNGSCSARDSIHIKYTDPVGINLGNDSVVCGAIQLMLDTRVDSAIYQWGDLSTQKTLVVDKPGTYRVVVTKNGCSDSDQVVINSQPSPVIDLGNDTFTCEGNAVILDAGEGYSGYLWQDGSSSRWFSTGKAGKYIVTVKDLNGCSASDEIVLSVNPIPAIHLPPLIKACEPDLVLAPGNFVSYFWQDGSLSDSYHATDYGTYSVTVTDINHCSNTVVMEIANGCPGILYVPNVFTPNSDRTNEIFIPVKRNIKTIDFSIYNRWGMLVFNSADLQEGWDGKYKGQEAVADVYVYVIKYTDYADDVIKSLNGNVTLLR